MWRDKGQPASIFRREAVAQVYQSASSVERQKRGPVITIGNFDGVHRGHGKLISRTQALAAELGVQSCALTFDPAPRDLLRPDNRVPRIHRLSDRVEQLAATGLDMVIVEPFTHEFAAKDAAWFVSELLLSKLNVSGVVVGGDFKFGKGREGDASTLSNLLPVPFESIGALEEGGVVVSSSLIRRSLSKGDIGTAREMLGRHHRVEGTVVRGDGRGLGLGFPTANVISQGQLIPGNGVYAVRAEVNDRHFAAVANIGTQPTFGGSERRLEVHLLGVSGNRLDLYGVEMGIFFVERIRGEQTFESKDLLIRAITADIEAAMTSLEGELR